MADISFPWEMFMQASQAKNQNRNQMNQDLGSIGQSFGQGFNTIGQAMQEQKKKQLLAQIVQAMNTQGAPQQGPPMPPPAMGQVPPGQPMSAGPGGQDVQMPPSPPTSGIGGPAQDNTKLIQSLMMQYDPQSAISRMPTPLQQSEIAKNMAGVGKLSGQSSAGPVGYLNPQTGEPSYTPKPGFNPMKGVSGNEFMTQFESFKNRGIKSAELGQKREEDIEQKMATALDPNAFRSGQMKQNQVRLDAGQRVMQLLQQTGGNPDSRQMQELAISVQNMLSNSQGSVAEVEALVPKTIRGNAQKQIEWWSNNPTGMEQQLFAKRLGETAQREMALAEDQIKQAQVQRLSGFQTFRKMAPDRYNAVLSSYGIDPSTIDDKGRFKRKPTPTVDSIYGGDSKSSSLTAKYEPDKEARYQAWKKSQGL